MKRKKLLDFLLTHGCQLKREGARHSIWLNPALNLVSSIPRHNDIKEILVKKICKDLKVPEIN